MRYILFGSEDFYYAQGGANDFIKTHDNKEELIELGKKMENESFRPAGVAWWHIFDIKEQKIIAGTKAQAHGALDLPDDLCL